MLNTLSKWYTWLKLKLKGFKWFNWFKCFKCFKLGALVKYFEWKVSMTQRAQIAQTVEMV